MDMFSDNFAVLGTRTTGQEGGTFTLVGPSDAASPDAIRSPTPWVWALARVVVKDRSDVPEALRVLHGFVCEGTPQKPAAAPGADRTGDWTDWMAAANALMIENPAPATDRRILRLMAPLGLGSPGFNPRKFPAADAAEIASGFAEGQALARSVGFGGKQMGGWLFPAANMGNFFQDYLTRGFRAGGAADSGGDVSGRNLSHRLGRLQRRRALAVAFPRWRAAARGRLLVSDNVCGRARRRLVSRAQSD
jgi:hypothetical protein